MYFCKDININDNLTYSNQFDTFTNYKIIDHEFKKLFQYVDPNFRIIMTLYV